MPRDLDNEILDLGRAGHFPQDTALNFMLSLKKVAAGEPLGVPEAGTEPAESVIMREQALALAQTQAELDANSQRAQELEERLMQAEDFASQVDAQAQESTARAGEAMESASMAEANAAAQADAKMRLAMRINQMRQQLADIVSSDPVMEEGVGTDEVAGPGTPQTSAQQAQVAEEEAALADEADAAAATTQSGSKVKKEVGQAERAQNEADRQKAQAAGALQKAAADFGSNSNVVRRWGQLHSKKYTQKEVGEPAGVGAAGGLGIGGLAGKFLRKNRKGLVLGAIGGTLAGGAIGAIKGKKDISKDRAAITKPLVYAGAKYIYKTTGKVPVSGRYDKGTGRLTIKTRDGKSFTAAPPKMAADESQDTSRVANALRSIDADNRIKRLVEGAFNEQKEPATTDHGELYNSIRSATSGKQLADRNPADPGSNEVNLSLIHI